ncbi:MAG: RNA methyltransferase [Bacteroidetes bacterium]|nr:RNA methyltransferase [Bacteroidota bacterium]
MIASLTQITTLDGPELEPFRTLRRPMEHLQQGIFVAEGEKVVRRLLESTLTVQRILLSADWFEEYRPVIEAHRHPIHVSVGEKRLLESIVGHELHQSIMAVGTVPPPLRIDQLPASRPSSLYVMVDGITNAENMGVIVRNCVCFDVNALIVLPNSCDPYLRRSVRNSMGNIFRLPIVYATDVPGTLDSLHTNGVTITAAHVHPDSRDIRALNSVTKRCLVLGAEGHGISEEVLARSTEFAVVPMRPGADSLNVASASAVLLWELRRTAEP